MGLRPGRCTRNIERSFTRVAPKVQRKNFLGGVPGVRTRDFAMGNQTKDYNTVFDIVAKESIQIRDNALEAMRQKLVKKLTKEMGKDDYFIKIRAYPHHIIREHKGATGAGADRVSSGMKKAFGKNSLRAVQIRKGQILLSVVIDSAKTTAVKKMLDALRYKINLDYEIKQSEHLNKRLCGRKKWTREAKLARMTGKDKESMMAKNAEKTAPTPTKGGKPANAKDSPKDAKADTKGKTAEPAKKGKK